MFNYHNLAMFIVSSSQYDSLRFVVLLKHKPTLGTAHPPERCRKAGHRKSALPEETMGAKGSDCITVNEIFQYHEWLYSASINIYVRIKMNLHGKNNIHIYNIIYNI